MTKDLNKQIDLLKKHLQKSGISFTSFDVDTLGNQLYESILKTPVVIKGITFHLIVANLRGYGVDLFSKGHVFFAKPDELASEPTDYVGQQMLFSFIEQFINKTKLKNLFVETNSLYYLNSVFDELQKNVVVPDSSFTFERASQFLIAHFKLSSAEELEIFLSDYFYAEGLSVGRKLNFIHLRDASVTFTLNSKLFL